METWEQHMYWKSNIWTIMETWKHHMYWTITYEANCCWNMVPFIILNVNSNLIILSKQEWWFIVHQNQSYKNDTPWKASKFTTDFQESSICHCCWRQVRVAALFKYSTSICPLRNAFTTCHAVSSVIILTSKDNVYTQPFLNFLAHEWTNNEYYMDVSLQPLIHWSYSGALPIAEAANLFWFEINSRHVQTYSSFKLAFLQPTYVWRNQRIVPRN